MTEITRVPLQPIAKGSVAKLWIGLAAALLAAGGIAWAATPPLVDVQTLTAGTGGNPQMGEIVIAKVSGKLAGSGKIFQQEQIMPLQLGGTVPGFTRALMQMQAGGKYTVRVPAALGYGDKAQGPDIPANSDLIFDVDLLQFMTVQEYQQQMMMMQQMQRLQHQGGGETGAAPQGAAPEGAAPEGAAPEGAVPVQ